MTANQLAAVRALLAALPPETRKTLRPVWCAVCEESESRVAELERDRDDLTRERDALSIELDRLRAEVDGENGIRASAAVGWALAGARVKTINEMAAERDDLKQRVLELEREKLYALADHEAARVESDRWRRHCKDSQSNEAKLIGERDAARAFRQQETERAAMLERERDKLLRERDSARASLAAAEAKIAEARGYFKIFYALPAAASEELPGRDLLDAAARAVRAQRDALPPQPEQPAAPEPRYPAAKTRMHAIFGKLVTRYECGCDEYEGGMMCCDEHAEDDEMPHAPAAPRIVDTSPRQATIRSTTPRQPSVSGEVVAEATGAEQPAAPEPQSDPAAIDREISRRVNESTGSTRRVVPADEPHGPTLAAALEAVTEALRAGYCSVSGPARFALENVAKHMGERAAKVRGGVEGG